MKKIYAVVIAVVIGLALGSYANSESEKNIQMESCIELGVKYDGESYQEATARCEFEVE